MAEHEIEIELPRNVFNAVLANDVRFVVRSDGRKLGELLVSKGSVAWLPVHFDSEPFHLSWERFDRVMRDEGRRYGTA